MNSFAFEALSQMVPSPRSVSVTPSDATVLKACRAFIPPEDGAVAFTNAEDGTVTIAPALKAGLVYPMSVTQIRATGTGSALAFVLLY